jgi:hypothetical protein
MTVRRLTLNDTDQLKILGTKRANIKGIMSRDLSLTISYPTAWLEGMKKYYLVGSDTHYIYGNFLDNTLVSCLAWRCDLPAPWNDGWVVGHLKTLPGIKLTDTGMIELWQKMFDVCEGKGLTKWHMLIPESTREGYQGLADRWFKDIDSRYTYDWTLIIPAGTRPNIDWVWGTMGRRPVDIELRLRTGVRK